MFGPQITHPLPREGFVIVQSGNESTQVFGRNRTGKEFGGIHTPEGWHRDLKYNVCNESGFIVFH
jgi:hypothetical protein